MPDIETHNGPFRCIHVNPLEIAPPGQSRIIHTELIEAAQRQRKSLVAAEQTAADIIRRAHTEAEALLQSMQSTHDAEFHARLLNIESDVSERLGTVVENLGEAIAESVEAIFKSLFNTDPTLLVKLTTEIAKHVLEHEISCIVHVNAVDRHDDSLDKLATRFELRPSLEVPRGTLIIASNDGEIRVDAKRLMDDLGKSLRQCFRSAEHTSDIQSRKP